MSKLSKILQRTLDDLDGKKPSLYDRLEDKWLHSKIRGKIEDAYYPVKNFFKNLPFFIKLAWRWRSWDQSYNINAFADMMEKTARSILKHGNKYQKEKTYRKMMQAAGQLRQAYDGYIDQNLVRLYQKNKMYFKKIEGTKFSTMEHEQNTPKHIYEALYKIAHERGERVVKERQEAAWKYIHKWSNYWWD